MTGNCCQIKQRMSKNLSLYNKLNVGTANCEKHTIIMWYNRPTDEIIL